MSISIIVSGIAPDAGTFGAVRFALLLHRQMSNVQWFFFCCFVVDS